MIGTTDGGSAMGRRELEAAIRSERAALVHDLADLTEAQWATPSLCAAWTVEEVAAHLVAGARVGRWAWLRSMVGARFDPAVHNARRLVEHRGATPGETWSRLRDVVDGPAGPTGHTAAWLGEVLVHAEDVRRPLGLERTPPTATSTAVACFFASRDFAVPSRSTVAGLRLEATDGRFATGAGPVVAGPTHALVLAMAGRPAALGDLAGDGVAVLRERLGAA